MKKNLLFICFSLSLIAFHTSCTSDYEERSDVSDSMLQERKSQIMEMASDYGLDGYVIDANKLRKNFLMSNKEVENEMKALAMLKGTYSLVSDDGTSFRIGSKNLRRSKRRRSIDNWPDDPLLTGDVGENYTQGDTVSIDYSFTIEFHRMSGMHEIKNSNFFAIIKLRNEQTNDYSTYTVQGSPSVSVTNILGAFPNFTAIGNVTVPTMLGSFAFGIQASFKAKENDDSANARFIIIQ